MLVIKYGYMFRLKITMLVIKYGYIQHKGMYPIKKFMLCFSHKVKWRRKDYL